MRPIKHRCNHPGCHALIESGRYCDEHKGDVWRKDPARPKAYGKGWQRKRSYVMARDDGLCQVCLRDGRVTPATQVDHIIPLAEGGTDDVGNLQAICASCHEAKTLEEARRGRQK